MNLFDHIFPDGFAAKTKNRCLPNVDTMNLSCITDANQLCALFQNSPEARKSYQSNDNSLLLFHIHIHVAAFRIGFSDSKHVPTKCKFCAASDSPENCTAVAVYSKQDPFVIYPYLLVKMFLYPVYTIAHFIYPNPAFIPPYNSVIAEICWTPPLPFCPGNASNATPTPTHIIIDFIQKVRSTMQIRKIHTSYITWCTS